MNYDSIIFDIDGTLWNACSASASGWNSGLKKLGIKEKITPEQIESVAGNPYDQCVEILLPGFQQKYPNLLETLNQYEVEAVKSIGGIFYNGVIDGIPKLAKLHKLFLVSNCQDWYMNLFIRLSGLEGCFIDFDCYGMSGVPKHEMLSKIINDYSLNKPVYIGDTEGDESAAGIAGMNFIHVSYGFGSATTKAISFNSFSALLGYFEDNTPQYHEN